jgi:hypothetical protein
VVVWLPSVAFAADEGCSSFDKITTGCINGPVVDVTGTISTPGSGPANSGGSGSPGGTGGTVVIWKCLEVSCSSDDPDAEPITLSDIASFRPRPGVQYMQPDGWMVPGLDANFYAVTSQHVVNGTLLGQPASVRFTPVAFHWDYGDGKAATRATKGATWAALGIPEFGPTPTSHVYLTEGEYTIRLTIDFAAEYRFAGSPYYPIAGVIPVPANELHVSVDGAKTVLVEHDCGANPSGPGC